jgi:hypothetical protein
LADDDRLHILSQRTLKSVKTTKIRIQIIGIIGDENGEITLSELFFVGK